MEEALLSSNRKQRHVYVVHGAGGIGKTRLVIEFAQRHHKRYTGIFWVDGSTQENIRRSFVAIKERLLAHQKLKPVRDITTNHEVDIQEAVHEVMTWLRQHGNNQWLMIFDNVESDWSPRINDHLTYKISDYFPATTHGSIMLTTRLARLEWIGNGSLNMPTMSKEQSEKLLVSVSGRIIIGWDELHTTLGGLPLALVLAGSYLKKNMLSAEKYIELYHQAYDRLIRLTRPPPDYSRHILETLQASFDQLHHDYPHSAYLFQLWSCLSNEDLHFDLLAPAARDMGQLMEGHVPEWFISLVSDEISFLERIQPLLNYSLAYCHNDSDGYSMHPIIHNWCFSQLHWKQEMAYLATLILGFAAPFRYEKNYSSSRNRLKPHIVRIASLLDTLPDFQIPKAKPYLLYWCFNRIAKLTDAYALNENRPSKQAIKIYQRALAGHQRIWGSNHVLCLSTIANLAMMYAYLGQMEETEELYQRALDGFEKIQPRKKRAIFVKIKSSGRLSWIEEVDEMYRHGLQGKKKPPECNHPSILSAVINLENVRCFQMSVISVSDNSVPDIFVTDLYNEVLKSTPTMGIWDHISTLQRNLGDIHYLSHRYGYVEAEQMLLRALKNETLTWGPHHTVTQDTISRLRTIYVKQKGPLYAKQKLQYLLNSEEDEL